MEILIENVNITLSPQAEDQWEKISGLVNDPKAKEKIINDIAFAYYDKMRKTKEELEKESGMMASLTTRIIDNLKLTISNVHFRIEQKDAVKID